MDTPTDDRKLRSDALKGSNVATAAFIGICVFFLGLAALLWLRSPRVTLAGHIALGVMSVLALAIMALVISSSFGSWGILVAELSPEGAGEYRLKAAGTGSSSVPRPEFIVKRINRRAVLLVRADAITVVRGDPELWGRVVNQADIPSFPSIGPLDLAPLRATMTSLFAKVGSAPEGSVALVSCGSTFEVMIALESEKLTGRSARELRELREAKAAR